jgi:hypothetical protein
MTEERSAGNPHATFCGNRRRVTASDDPVMSNRYSQKSKIEAFNLVLIFAMGFLVIFSRQIG